MVNDMKSTKDSAQYGNEKSVSIQHYLVRMINTILTAVDRNSKSESNAVLVQLIDWKSTFDRSSLGFFGNEDCYISLGRATA